LPAQALDVASRADIKRFAGLRVESTYGAMGESRPLAGRTGTPRDTGTDRQQRHVVDDRSPITHGRWHRSSR